MASAVSIAHNCTGILCITALSKQWVLSHVFYYYESLNWTFWLCYYCLRNSILSVVLKACSRRLGCTFYLISFYLHEFTF